MGMNIDLLLSTLVTLLVTVDPVGLAPIFLSLTERLTLKKRRSVAFRAAAISFLVLAFFVLAGQRLLDWLGIGLPAFRIGGGLLLFWIAFEMVFERRAERKQKTAEQNHRRDLAAFPLAIPLVAGPGAITAVILLSSRADGSVVALALLLLLVGSVVLACLGVFLASQRISRLLGRTGSIVLTRLLGVLLTALAVQFVADGTRALLQENGGEPPATCGAPALRVMTWAPARPKADRRAAPLPYVVSLGEASAASAAALRLAHGTAICARLHPFRRADVAGVPPWSHCHHRRAPCTAVSDQQALVWRLSCSSSRKPPSARARRVWWHRWGPRPPPGPRRYPRLPPSPSARDEP